MKKIVFLFFVLAVFAGCTASQQNTVKQPYQEEGEIIQEQTVQKGDRIRVDYVGRLEDGTVFDQSAPEQPLEFTVGSGELIQGFDEGVIGMKKGETKTVSIPTEKAYGEKSEENIFEIEKTRFGADSNNLRVGMEVTAKTGYTGMIAAIYDENILIDFNPPLAGKTLIFEITLREIVK